jgi:hypothetical protein
MVRIQDSSEQVVKANQSTEAYKKAQLLTCAPGKVEDRQNKDGEKTQ